MSDSAAEIQPPSHNDSGGQEFDVLIVGAGPAGSSAAASFLLSNPALRVALVDKQDFPRDKACGDGIGPAAVAELSALGIDTTAWEAAKPISAAVVHGPSGSAFTADISNTASDMHGLTVRRTVFDEALLRRAEELGAMFLPSLRFEQIVGCDADSQEIAFTASDGSAESLRCRLLVGADGASSRVRNAIGIAPQPPQRTGIAIRAYTQMLSGDTDKLYISFDGGLRPGYGWCFPLADGNANIGVGIVVQDHRRRSVNLRDLLLRYQESLCARGIVTEGLGQMRTHILPHGGKLPDMVSDRVALVGDAAALINPLSGEGIAYGMKAARMLAEETHAAIAGGTGLDSALAGYQLRIRRSFAQHMRSNYLAHRLLRSDTWSRHVLRAAERDIQMQRLAVDLMFGDGRLNLSSFARLLRPHRRRMQQPHSVVSIK